MRTDEFRQAVTTLMEIAADRHTCIMCAEGEYRHCHRRLLSDYLVSTGVTVSHILPSGGIQPHVLAPGAKIVDESVTYPGQPTLFEM